MIIIVNLIGSLLSSLTTKECLLATPFITNRNSVIGSLIYKCKSCVLRSCDHKSQLLINYIHILTSLIVLCSLINSFKLSNFIKELAEKEGERFHYLLIKYLNDLRCQSNYYWMTSIQNQ